MVSAVGFGFDSQCAVTCEEVMFAISKPDRIRVSITRLRK